MLALVAGTLFAVVLSASQASATIDNTAVAKGTYAASIINSNSVTVNVPVGAANSSFIVTKSASPSSNVQAGQVVTYTYTVKNNGNVTLHNISLADVHNATGAAPRARH